MRSKLWLLIPIFILLTGCHTEESIEIITFTPSDDYNVVFIPKTTTDDMNEMYMDVFIELKARYPLEFKEVKKTEKKPEELNLNKKKIAPSLTIFKNGRVVVQLSGDPSKDVIKENLEITIGNEEKDVPN